MNEITTVDSYIKALMTREDVDDLGDTCQLSMRVPVANCAELDALSKVLRKNRTSLSRSLLIIAIKQAVNSLDRGYDDAYAEALEHYQIGYEETKGQRE